MGIRGGRIEVIEKLGNINMNKLAAIRLLPLLILSLTCSGALQGYEEEEFKGGCPEYIEGFNHITNEFNKK